MTDMTERELIHAFAHGISEQRYTTVIMQSDRFVIFRIKGHTDWSGVGMRSYYPSETVLIRKGNWWLSTETKKRTWEGRIGRKELSLYLERAEYTGEV